jgi:hypothetical protein
MATPTLKRSWSFAGLSGNNPDTGNNFKIQLEAAGTPRAVVAGDLVLVSVAFHNGLTCTISDDQTNTWSSAISVANATLTTPRKYQIFWAVAAGSMKTITVGFGGLTTDVQIDVSLWYNTATVSPIDGAGIATVGITPANNTAPNIQPGSFNTTVDGDLIYNIIFDESNGTIGVPNAWNGVTFGSGFTGLFAEVFYGAAAQSQVQGTHGAINPGITVSQTTHDSFASLAIAIKAGTGGAAPGAGISIVRSQMVYIVSFSGATAVPFPTSGNLLVVCNEAGSLGSNLSSVTDGTNTYTQIASTPSGFPELFRADNATTGNSLVVTLTTNTGSGNDLIGMYDVTGAASSPLDTAATAANSSTLTAAGSGATTNSGTNVANASLTDAPSIVPSTSNGLVIAAFNIGTGPSSGSTTQTYDYVAATWNTGGGDNNGFGNGDGVAHFFNSTASTVNFQYTMTNPGASWAALAAAFKAAPAGSSAGFQRMPVFFQG